ncbi:MAG: hypothetical protein E6G56_07640 [Actinobacteria bacterium]|nr:MAG: hypothetical protein E6G56_07640 [Actinomycetota bacterium]
MSALIDLAGGSMIFLAFLVVFLLAVIYGLYSRSGSGIAQRPYGSIYGGAPGARGASTMGNDRVAAEAVARRRAARRRAARQA